VLMALRIARRNRVVLDGSVHPEYRSVIGSYLDGRGIDLVTSEIELNGTIGVQRDYCVNQENRWDELSTPLPFVFFHPQLPVYIVSAWRISCRAVASGSRGSALSRAARASAPPIRPSAQAA